MSTSYQMEPQPQPQPIVKKDSANIHAKLHKLAKDLPAQRERLRGEILSSLRRDLAVTAKPFIDDISNSILNNSRDHSADLLRELNIYTEDIEQNCAELKQQVVEDRYSGQLLTVKMRSDIYVPVSRREMEKSSIHELDRAYDLQLVPNVSALEGFASELEAFVVQRMVADVAYQRLDALVGGGSFGRNSLPVHVHSQPQSSGASVHYSAAYHIAFLYLASPTSPAKSAVDPGRYLFKLTKPGIQGNPSSDYYDNGIYDIPDAFDIYLTI